MKKKSFVLALVSVLMVGGGMGFSQQRTEKEAQELAKKWLVVNGWEGTYTSSYTSEKTVEIGGGSTITTSIRTRLTASAVMDEYYDPPSHGYAEFQGVGTASFVEIKQTTMVHRIEGGELTIREIIKTESAGKIGGGEVEDEYGANLSIDCYSGTYSFGFADPMVEGITTVSRSISGMPTNFSVLRQAPEPYATLFGQMGEDMEAYANYNGDLENAGPLLTGVGSMMAMQLMPDFDRPTEFPLPESGLVLAGAYSSANETESWRIAPKGRSQFMELQKCDKEWIPDVEPAAPAITAARIKITGEGWMGEPAKLKITLFEVTREDGEAINYLGDERPRDAFDLDFDHPDNKTILGEQREIGDGYEIETTKEVMNLEFRVSCYDHAAWGKLKVEAKLKDSDDWYPVLTPENKEYITVPLDERGDWENKIADRWEEIQKLPEVVNGLEDEEMGMGDGLTLHEEYRGFFVKGTDDPYHIRGDVDRLDVFVFCEDRLLSEAARDVEDAYPNLRMRLLDYFCAPPLRIINPYSSENYKEGDQHYIRMYRGNLNTAGLLGVTKGNGMSSWTPVDVVHIIIDVAEIRKFGSPVNQTVVHEIFHAIGVRHHGDDNKNLPVSVGGKPPEEFRVATYGGPNSGMVECVMSYRTADFFADASGNIVRDESGEPVDFVSTIEYHRHDVLCVDREGTGPNKDGGQVGDAKKGICYAQVRVRDY